MSIILRFRMQVATLLAFLGLFGLDHFAFAVSPSDQEFLRRIWQAEDGLPNPVVRSVLQTPDGYLWVATEESLARFDGVGFTEFDRKNPREKGERWIVAMVVTKDGSLWYSSANGGLGRLKDGKTVRYTTGNGLPGNYVLSLCEDRQGNLWIGTSVGLAKFVDGKFLSLTNSPGLVTEAVRSIIETRDRTLWIGTAKGLCRFKDEKFTFHSLGSNPEINAILSLCEDRDGNLWIGTSAGGLVQWKDDKVKKRHSTKTGLAHNVVRKVYEDRAGNLWIGTHSGLQRFINGKFFLLKCRDTSSAEMADSISDVIYDITEDKEGNIWAGTSVGLTRLKIQRIKTYSKEDGLPHVQTTAVFQDRFGAVWVGTFGGGLCRFQDGELVVFTTSDGLDSNHILSIYEDREGTMWIGTDGVGLNRYKDGAFSHFSMTEGAPANTIKMILQDRAGNLWVGNNIGVSRFADGKFIPEPQLIRAGVKAMIEDRKGNLWIGTRSGLIYWNNGKTNVFNEKSGLSSELINALYEDKEGTLWIGTELGGLNRFKNGKFTPYSTSQGFNERVLHILEDDQNNLWMATRNGIVSVNKKELNDFADGRISSINFVSYGKSDGMRRAQCNGIAQPAGWKTREGYFWFPTLHGVVAFNPNEVIGNRVPPPVVIEKVIVDGKSFVDWRSGRFPPGGGHFDFHYAGLSFNVPEKVRFKYKLEGFDHDWQDASNRRVARYTNLRPGDYQFRVKACNNDGIWNETGASFAFTLSPNFYKTGFFYAGCSIVAIFAGMELWRFRIRRMKRREKELLEIVNDRTREMQQEVAERKQAVRRATAFSKLGERLSLAASQEQAAEVIADTAEELLGWDVCSLYAYNADIDKGNPLVVFNIVNDKRVNVAADFAHLDLSEVARRAIEQGAQLVLRDQTNAPAPQSFGEEISRRSNSLMFVPIRKGSKAVGILSVQSYKIRAYDQSDLKTLQALADYCGGAFNRIRAEEALRESQQVILRQERLAAVGQLSAGVAHEFNNILTIIKGHANLLADYSHTTPETRASLAQIISSSERAANLTRQMLAFSRKQVMQAKILNLKEVVTEVTKMLSRLLGENISLCCDFAPNLPPVRADAGMMEQIIMNLALNARDAMPKGGRLTITGRGVLLNEQVLQGRSEAYPGLFVCLAITDTGCGMDEATLQRIFEPFFTTKEVGKGTGLGLSTVYGIVKQHHGWIEVTSKKGKGTTFNIFLPVAASQTPQASQKIPPAPVRGGSETILFVEDEPDIRKLARQVLERYGYQVLEAGCGVEALKVWEQHKNDVALLMTDMMMPEGISGRDLAKELQAQKNNLKVIYTSGYSVEILEKDFAMQGGSRFLPKPYQPQKLAQTIRDCLDSVN